jgi:hypothetical protein
MNSFVAPQRILDDNLASSRSLKHASRARLDIVRVMLNKAVIK